MRVIRVVTAVAGIGLLSGCAGGQTRAGLARLQSQVNLLDERIGQLERTTTASTPSASWNEIGGPGETLASSASATAPRSASPTPAVVGKGSAKASTREIQQALKNAGFYQGAVDGKMGAQTREAIKEFQRVHGLKDDGVAGKQTWAKLSAYADLSSAKDSTTEVSLK